MLVVFFLIQVWNDREYANTDEVSAFGRWKDGIHDEGKQTLELNNNHPIVTQLRKYFREDTENENIENLIHTVYQCCAFKFRISARKSCEIFTTND